MTTVGLVRVEVVLESAGGVTAPELDTAVDLALSRRQGNGTTDDEVWTPPTSLAGSLRTHVGTRAERWFGSEPPPSGRALDDRQLEPSRVRFLGSRTLLPDTGPQVRRSTAIDPCRGAAASSTLRAAEVAPAGTIVTLYLRFDQHPGTDELAELAAAVSTWRPIVGRGRSTGHGRARVTQVAWRRIDLRTSAGLRLWLTGGRDGLFPEEGWDDVRTPDVPASRDPELDLRFAIGSALHVGGGGTTTDDGITRNAVTREVGALLVPGTTWKGLLRSRCGYILRSCGQPACLAPAERSCRSCMVCGLFGWTGEGSKAGTSIGHVGRVTVHDGRINVPDAELNGGVTHRNHVGIDRFTGGARRALLFSDDVVAAGEVSLRVEVTDDADRLEPAERGLLLLAVRDLHDGLIGVGRGTTRGYGSLRLTPGSELLLDELAPSHPTGSAVSALLREEKP